MMLRHFSIFFLSFWTVCCSSALADEVSDMFEPGNAMCQGWLYLHCGVPIGHVFEGKLEVLLAVDRNGTWRAVSPRWRSRRLYSLHGYLLLEGRGEDGYVLFPRQRFRGHP